MYYFYSCLTILYITGFRHFSLAYKIFQLFTLYWNWKVFPLFCWNIWLVGNPRNCYIGFCFLGPSPTPVPTHFLARSTDVPCPQTQRTPAIQGEVTPVIAGTSHISLFRFQLLRNRWHQLEELRRPAAQKTKLTEKKDNSQLGQILPITPEVMWAAKFMTESTDNQKEHRNQRIKHPSNKDKHKIQRLELIIPDSGAWTPV